MTKLVVDSWTWIEYFAGSDMGKKADNAMADSRELLTSVASVAEVVSKYRRNGKDDEQAVRAITALSKIGIPSLEDAIDAGKIHAEMKARITNFSFADSFVLQLARSVGAKVLTGDPDFRGIKEAIEIG